MRKSTQPRHLPSFLKSELVTQTVLISLGLVISLPVLIAIFTSFKLPNDVVDYPPNLIPQEWSLASYITAWNGSRKVDPDNVGFAGFIINNFRTGFGRFLINSFVQASLITVSQVIFSVLAAYAFAYLQFPGRNVLFFLVLGSLMVPFELTFIPNFQLVSALKWTNTYQGLVVPFFASAFGIFLLRQFFMTIPNELHDAALIDGAGNWRYLWRVVVPLSKGPIGAFAIFAFVSAYNQYFWPLIITNEIEMRTTQIGIRFFMVDTIGTGPEWGAIMAATVIVSAPLIIFFLVAQKQLLRGIGMAGLKR